MKKIFISVLSVALLITAAACGGGDEPVGEGIQTAAILFDFSNGSPEENVKWATHYSYSYITRDEIISMMSEMSGLDFFITISTPEGRIVADWSATSTLIAGLDEREQKEDYHFYDADSMRWFMMDSLRRTLMNLYSAEEIYYTMDGGKELAFDDLSPVNVFPADAPYMGSAFYFARADAASLESESGEGATGIDEEEAMDILSGALEMAEGTAIVSYGEEIINGVHCWTFAYGMNTPEKFTAEVQYAVTDYGKILVYSFADNEYKELETP